jgi:hypothetical protein
MSPQRQELNSIVPDLRDFSLERFPELRDSFLAHSVALYRQELKRASMTPEVGAEVGPAKRPYHAEETVIPGRG